MSTLPTPSTWTLPPSKFSSVYPHHTSLRALWELKWRFPCSLSVYPFHDGKIEDFQPIFEKLIEDNEKGVVGDAYEDGYTERFLPRVRELVGMAKDALRAEGGSGKGDGKGRAEAIELYKRAACVLRIARFPSLDAGVGKNGEMALKRRVWEEQKRGMSASFLRRLVQSLGFGLHVVPFHVYCYWPVIGYIGPGVWSTFSFPPSFLRIFTVSDRDSLMLISIFSLSQRCVVMG
jgi:hypothetical protein